MNKLMRSSKDKVISGVCGGIGEYFDIDSTIVRLIFIIFIFMSFGTAVLVYFVSALIMPMDDGLIYNDPSDSKFDENENQEKYERNEKIKNNTPVFIGLGFILWGSYLIIKRMFPSMFFTMRRMWNLLPIWPILLIIIGLYVIFQQKNK